MVEDEGVREVAEAQPAFARFFGIELIRYSRDLIIAELVVRQDHALAAVVTQSQLVLVPPEPT